MQKGVRFTICKQIPQLSKKERALQSDGWKAWNATIEETGQVGSPLTLLSYSLLHATHHQFFPFQLHHQYPSSWSPPCPFYQDGLPGNPLATSESCTLKPGWAWWNTCHPHARITASITLGAENQVPPGSTRRHFELVSHGDKLILSLIFLECTCPLLS